MNEQAVRIQRAITLLADKMWIGNVLQSMRILPTNQLPTAGVMFDEKLKTLNMVYNPEFMSGLTDKQVGGVLKHEIMHITEMHVYMYRKASRNDHKRLNIAMDLVINQKLAFDELPDFVARIEHFKDKNGVQFPPNLGVENYYDLLEDSKYDNPDSKGGNGEPQELDQHFWDNVSKEEAAEAVASLLKRAQNSYEKRHGRKCPELSDYLEKYNKVIKGVNFKEILLACLRNLTPGNDIKKTWAKPSRRYGTKAKGKLFKPSPNVHIFGDTSGSMSLDEINDILTMMNSFLESGAKKVDLSLFHHSLYYTKPFKKGDKFKPEDLQSGGTELSECFKHIEDNHIDLAVFITDGHYGMPYLPKNLNANLFFIIKNGGMVDHCLKKYGKTIVYESERKG